MNAGHFDRPVKICLPENRRSITINNASEAASVLADKWPLTYGRCYQHALAACAAVSEGQMTAADARKALIAAASEAGVSAEDELSAAILISPEKLANSTPIVLTPGEQSSWAGKHAGTRAPRPTF
jgi:hypothetical protein